MDRKLRPAEVIAALVRERSQHSDRAILDELDALPALADEADVIWTDTAYWTLVAYPYIAFADLAGMRGLREAIRPLLDRACFGDPGEMMRGLRHTFEGIMKPDWAALADICMAAIETGRPGTVLWAVEQLGVLEDARAKPVLMGLSRSEHPEIRDAVTDALERLDRAAKRSNS